MKYFDWDETKNSILIKQRNISFEEIVYAIDNGGLLDRKRHPNKEKYPNQKIFFVEVKDYVYIVPFVEDEEKYFLKTIYPSRKAYEKYKEKK